MLFFLGGGGKKCFYERQRKFGKTQWGEGKVKVEAETGGMWSQSEGCWSSHWKWKEARNRFFQSCPKGRQFCHILGLIGSRNLAEHISIVSSQQICGDLLEQPQKTEAQGHHPDLTFLPSLSASFNQINPSRNSTFDFLTLRSQI